MLYIFKIHLRIYNNNNNNNSCNKLLYYYYYFLTFFTPTTNSIYFDCVDDFQLRILLYSFFSIFGFVLILLLLLPVKRWLC